MGRRPEPRDDPARRRSRAGAVHAPAVAAVAPRRRRRAGRAGGLPRRVRRPATREGADGVCGARPRAHLVVRAGRGRPGNPAGPRRRPAGDPAARRDGPEHGRGGAPQPAPAVPRDRRVLLVGLTRAPRLPERVPRHRRHARAGRAGAGRRHRHPRRGEPHGGRGSGGVLAAGDGRAGAGRPRAVGGPAHRRWAGVGGVHGVPLHPHGLGGAVAQPARDGSPARTARSGPGRRRVRGAGPRPAAAAGGARHRRCRPRTGPGASERPGLAGPVRRPRRGDPVRPAVAARRRGGRPPGGGQAPRARPGRRPRPARGSPGVQAGGGHGELRLGRRRDSSDPRCGTARSSASRSDRCRGDCSP